jgi:hypothetical protein
MKQIIDLQSIWFSTKRALYAAMVIILSLSIPALSYMELSHSDKEPVKSEQIAKNNGSMPLTAPFQKQS